MDVSQIFSKLFVGSYPGDIEDIDQLKRDFGITAVLNVQTDEDLAYWGINWGRLECHYHKLGVEIQRAPVRDFDPVDLRRKLPECVKVLDLLLQQGHNVYVHCSMGINRSPSVAIA